MVEESKAEDVERVLVVDAPVPARRSERVDEPALSDEPDAIADPLAALAGPRAQVSSAGRAALWYCALSDEPGAIADPLAAKAGPRAHVSPLAALAGPRAHVSSAGRAALWRASADPARLIAHMALRHPSWWLSDPDRAEKKVLEARVVCAKTNKAEYETEARRLFQGCLSQGMTMSACQPTSVHSLQMERDGVSRASHDKAKQLREFKKGAAAEQAEAAGKLATLDAEIAARTTKITALRAQKTAAGVAKIAAEGGLVREGADRCAFHSGAFVGEHAKVCLYNAKQLGMSVVDAMPDASKPLALEIVKKHVCLWRRLAIVHALARPSRMLAFEEVEILKVACKDYDVAFRATFVGRNVPLMTHVLETELPAFAAKWFCCGIMCEDAAESIHALKKRLKRRYACIRDKKRNVECQRNAILMLRTTSVAAATPSGRPSE
ncbi:hypothetical protein M885DRAFT_573883 [Pelagophyceae sp. CCMP2097]|nr:hypothetical protein M885DRAFT_573883 [Pelagophyceae sp. CCMP2097]